MAAPRRDPSVHDRTQCDSARSQIVRGVAYTTAEKELLAQIFPTATKEELLAAFPGRTVAGLEAEARVLRIRRDAATSRAKRQASNRAAALRVLGIDPPQSEPSIVRSALANLPALQAAWMGRAA